MKVIVFVKDEDEDLVVNTIMNSAKTGKIGDGKIFVSSIDEIVRIRTNEKGDEAI